MKLRAAPRMRCHVDMFRDYINRFASNSRKTTSNSTQLVDEHVDAVNMLVSSSNEEETLRAIRAIRFGKGLAYDNIDVEMP
ncbi:hypothetical protein GJ496_004088 [Pomphorhynchus laevis]|nr:hypothetical protein GJ496_004088 [Pomphorhynchus laevis]